MTSSEGGDNEDNDNDDDNNRSQNYSIDKKTMMRTFSPPDLSSPPPTEPSICAALDVVPIQRCSLRLSSYDDDKYEENHLYIFT